MIVTMLFVFGIAGIIGTVVASKTVDRHCETTLLGAMVIVCASVGFARCERRQYGEPDGVDRLLGRCDDGRLLSVSDGVAHGRSRCG